MSCVTSTIAFAERTSSRIRALLFARKIASPVARTSSRRSDRRRDREAQPGAHAGRVRLDRRVDELAEVRELDDRLQALDDLPVFEPEEGSGEEDVLAPREVLVEAGAQRQEAAHLAADDDPALGRRQDPCEHLEQRALAGPVRPDDRERLTLDEIEVHVPEGPEVPGSLLLPEHVDEGAPEGVLLREAQAVADPHVADLDDARQVGGRVRRRGRRGGRQAVEPDDLRRRRGGHVTAPSRRPSRAA
jgi:hypothetical protein